MESLEKIYDRFAEKYDRSREAFDTASIFNDFLQGLKIQQGHLLDLGCGAGEPVARLSPSTGGKLPV